MNKFHYILEHICFNLMHWMFLYCLVLLRYIPLTKSAVIYFRRISAWGQKRESDISAAVLSCISVYLHVWMVKKDLSQIHLAENNGISVERQTGPLPCFCFMYKLKHQSTLQGRLCHLLLRHWCQRQLLCAHFTAGNVD